MVILHDAIKTIQNGVCVFFLKEQNPVSLKNNKNTWILKKPKNTGGLFLKKLRFF